MEDRTEHTVSAALSRLREIVRPHSTVNERLTRDQPARWGQLCACMDVIGDCDWAIGRYQQGPPTDDLGFLYLMTYGLLQVLFVQQDAITHAAAAVGMPYTRPAELSAIRGIRNEATGHAPERSFGIVQITLSYDSFTRYSFDPSTPRQWQETRFSELIASQAPHIIAGLNAIANHLETTYEN